MKKLLKFLFQLLAICGLGAGIFYLYKQYMQKDVIKNEDEDFYDDFQLDDEDFTETVSDSREYVTLNSIDSKMMPSTDDDSTTVTD